MPKTRLRRLATVSLVTAALAAGCSRHDDGSAPDGAAPAPGSDAYYARALASLEAIDDPPRAELLKTCDKWRHVDRECDAEALRKDVLDCWASKGEAIWKWTGERAMRPRARAMRTLLEVNTCLELRRWRKLAKGSELIEPRETTQ